MQYDKSGNFMKSFKTDGYYPDGAVTDSGTLLLYVINQTRQIDDTTSVYSLIEIDTEGTVLNRYPNSVPRYVESLRGGGLTFSGSLVSPLYSYNGHIRFNELSSDTIHTIEKGSMTPYAIMDFKNMKVDYAPDLSFTNSQEEKKAIFAKNDTKIMVYHISETNRFIYLYLVWGYGIENIFCIYNKESGELKNLGAEGMINDIDGGLSFFPRMIKNDNLKITWKNADEFKEEILSKDHDAQKAKYGEKFEKVYQLAKSLKDDDNQVLILAK
jgi:hypothetical protein